MMMHHPHFSWVLAFLALFSVCQLFRSVIHTYQASIVQSIERQFQLPSSMSGTLFSSGEIGYLVTVLFFAHYGSRGNRTRWLGFSFILSSIACIVITLPEFIFPRTPEGHQFNLADLPNDTHFLYSNQSVDVLYKYAKSEVAYCNPLGNFLKPLIKQAQCQLEPPNQAALAIIFIALLALSVASSIPYSLGMPMIEDFAKNKKNTPIYMGAIQFLHILGPLIGTAFGAAFTAIYVTTKPAPHGISQRDPRWIGAWWLGYLVVGMALILPSIGLFLFPFTKVEVKRKDTAENAKQNVHNELSAHEKEEFEEALLEKQENVLHKGHRSKPQSFLGLTMHAFTHEASIFFKAMKAILKSPLYVALLLDRLLGSLAYRGLHLFLPKYVETHYGLTMSQANLFSNGVGIFGWGIGIAIGSLIIRKKHFTGRNTALLMGICTLVSTTVSIAQIGLGCTSTLNSAGMAASAVEFNLTDSCNANCSCTALPISPVCSEDGRIYFNPCVAGCSSMNTTNKETVYHGCTCSNSTYQQLSRKFCKNDCETVTIIYFVSRIVGAIIGGIGMTPGTLLLLRAVPKAHRSLALGFMGFLPTLLTKLPSSIIFGSLIDSTCLRWTSTCQGTRGSCELYDPTQLRLRLYFFAGIVRALGLLTDGVVWYYSKHVTSITGAKENASKENTNKNEEQEAIES